MLGSETILFVGSHYEVKGSQITKYYGVYPASGGAGATRIATPALAPGTSVRKYTIPQSMTVEYFLTDHLGSTTLTTDANSAKVSEMRYREASLWDKPWGEVRYAWTSGLSTTPAYQLTRYTYTGQYSYMDDPITAGVTEGFGLMFYNARWYDPALGRFAQADTIIPSTQGVQAWDRFAYVNNAPTRFTDPSGHRYCSDIDKNGNCLTEDDLSKVYEDTPWIITLGIPGTNDKNKGFQIFGNFYAGCNYRSCTQVTIYSLSGVEGDNLQFALYQSALGRPVDYVIGKMEDALTDELLESIFGKGSREIPVAGAIFDTISEAHSQDFAVIAEMYQTITNRYGDEKPKVGFAIITNVKSGAGGVLVDSTKIGIFWTSSKGNSPVVLIPSYLQNQLMELLKSVTK